jgi:hypothetical protein
MLSPALLKWGIDLSNHPPERSEWVEESQEPIVRFFAYHDAHPVALVMTLLSRFGADWVEWEPDTLRSEIHNTFLAPSASDGSKTSSPSTVSPHNWEKIQAVRTLMTSSTYWNEWHIFEKINQALNNNIPQFDIAQRCTVAQLMAGVDIATQVREEPFEDEIARYIAACALDEFIVYLPPPLDFAQNVLSQPMYRCHVCGNVDPDDLDGRCDFCTGRFQDEHPFNFKPSPYVADSAGRNVERFLLRDYLSTKIRFDEVSLRGIASVKLNDEVLEDVQAAKLVVAYEYMQTRRKQLVDQLEEIKSWVLR